MCSLVTHPSLSHHPHLHLYQQGGDGSSAQIAPSTGHVGPSRLGTLPHSPTCHLRSLPKIPPWRSTMRFSRLASRGSVCHMPAKHAVLAKCVAMKGCLHAPTAPKPISNASPTTHASRIWAVSNVQELQAQLMLALQQPQHRNSRSLALTIHHRPQRCIAATVTIDPTPMQHGNRSPPTMEQRQHSREIRRGSGRARGHPDHHHATFTSMPHKVTALMTSTRTYLQRQPLRRGQIRPG